MARRTFTLIAAGLTGLALASPAHAATGSTGAYANWTVDGKSGAMDPPAAGFTAATWKSDASTVKAPSGASTFLGPNTPVGTKYGSSKGDSYLNISTAPGLADSVTTIDFDQPTPAKNWAFVLGDVDADEVVISAIDADGNAVTADQLGFAGVFNYCDTSPKPPVCAGGGPFDDVPTWHPGSSRLTGNGPDTTGAAGWFEPTVPLKSISFKFKKITGIPVFQLWITSLAVPVEAVIDGVTPQVPVPDPGIQLDLLDKDGDPVIDGGGEPAVAEVEEFGHAEFPAVIDGSYIAEIAVPPQVPSTGAKKFAFKVNGDPVKLPPGVFAVIVPLPPTGNDSGPIAALGLALLAAGAVVYRSTRPRSAG